MRVEGKHETPRSREQRTGLTGRAMQFGAGLLIGLTVLGSDPNTVRAEAEEPEPAHEDTVTSGTGKSFEEAVIPICVDGLNAELHTTIEPSHDTGLSLVQVTQEGEREVLGWGAGAGIEVTAETSWDSFNVGTSSVTTYNKATFFEDGSTATGQTITYDYPCDGGETEPEPEPKPTPGPGEGGTEDALNKKQRISGSDRFATAVAMSETHFDPWDTDTVIVTTGEDFPDALAGAALGGALDAPILLSQQGELNKDTAREIDRLDADKAVILGGTAALSNQVAQELRNEGLNVERIAGSDRFATAAAIGDAVLEIQNAEANAATVFTQDTESDTVETAPESSTAEPAPEDPEPETENRGRVFLANGTGFADSVAVSAMAARNSEPILLTTSGTLHTATKAWLANHAADINVVTTLGGSAAVTESSANKAANTATADSDRLAGATRTHTSAEIAARDLQEQNEAGHDLNSIYVATATGFPDALTGGPSVYKKDGSVLVTVIGQDPSTDAHVPFNNFVKNNKTDSTEELVAIGGDAAISNDTFNTLGTIADSHPNNPSAVSSSASTASATNKEIAANDALPPLPAPTENSPQPDELRGVKMVFPTRNSEPLLVQKPVAA